MHAIFENGLWLTCNMGNCHSISMANSTHQFLQMKILPSKSTSLTGIAKEGYVCAQDVVDVMATPEMKQYLGTKSGITKQTGWQWLHAMEWRYGVGRCQGMSETGDMLHPSTHGALTYLQNGHSRG